MCGEDEGRWKGMEERQKMGSILRKGEKIRERERKKSKGEREKILNLW